MSFDFPDALAAVGIAILGYALFEILGWPGVIGYVGALLIVFALLLADNRPRRQRGP